MPVSTIIMLLPGVDQLSVTAQPKNPGQHHHNAAAVGSTVLLHNLSIQVSTMVMLLLGLNALTEVSFTIMLLLLGQQCYHKASTYTSAP